MHFSTSRPFTLQGFLFIWHVSAQADSCFRTEVYPSDEALFAVIWCWTNASPPWPPSHLIPHLLTAGICYLQMRHVLSGDPVTPRVHTPDRFWPQIAHWRSLASLSRFGVGGGEFGNQWKRRNYVTRYSLRASQVKPHWSSQAAGMHKLSEMRLGNVGQNTIIIIFVTFRL